PNFMKVAPVMAALEQQTSVRQSLVHTGQHYDRNMSDVFFEQLQIPKPDVSLGVGSGSHARQTADIMVKLEASLLEQRPDWMIVYGDVNSTVAAALVCAKLEIPVAHVEAGLRSFDRRMPEEINRMVTDRLSELYFTPSTDGDQNLIREGVDSQRIHCVGNVMIDTLKRLQSRAVLPDLPGRAERYGLVTLHRPSNVDDATSFQRILESLLTISRKCQLLFPIHPRTRARFPKLIDELQSSDILTTEPVGYLEFLALQQHATFVITDSGGIQEETTYMGVPCLTLRENTERPVTVEIGTNILIGQDMDLLIKEVDLILQGQAKPGAVPEFWDGQASLRIAEVLLAVS
ncbi:MAG: UDP-N-acetylglucosamine 2-epimerase (non-hydrolyzing), partial [Planctomycetaceae bacterium]